MSHSEEKPRSTAIRQSTGFGPVIAIPCVTPQLMLINSQAGGLKIIITRPEPGDGGRSNMSWVTSLRIVRRG